jgi:sugar lactone lactonase YvrE
MPTPLVTGNLVCIAPVEDLCGEGAVWHPQKQALYWTDINRFLIHRWDSCSHAVETWQFSEPVTALTLTTRNDVLLVVLASRVMLWQPSPDSPPIDARDSIDFALPEWPEARCNDARVDPAGVLWISTMQNNVGAGGEPLLIDQTLGCLLSLDSAGTTRTWRTQLHIGNTLAWSPDSRFMYTADTLADEIHRYDWNNDSSLRNETLWFKGNGHGLPDGSAMDSEGYLWKCRHGGGCILRIDPNGAVERMITMPVKNPTTCIFGGNDGTTLYVTSARLDDPEHPLAGSLFSIETNVRGLPPNRFRLKSDQ